MNLLTPGLLLAAFAFALMPLSAYEAESFMIAVLLAAGAVVAAVALPKGGRVYAAPRSGLLAAGFTFWALALLSVFLSEVPYVSFLYFCFFSVLPLSFLAALASPDPRLFFKATGYALALVFAGLAVTSLAQYFLFPEMLNALKEGRAAWPLSNPNSLGGLYVLGFFGALGWMLAAPDRRQSNLALGLGILLIAALFATGSRGAMLSLLGGIAVFAAFAPAHFRRHWRCAAILAGVSILAFLLVGFAAPFSYIASWVQEYSAGGEIAAQQINVRFSLWGSALEIIRDYFWTGTGIGTFFLYYPQYRGADFDSAGLMVHSDPLQFWAEMGVFAPVLFYLFIAGALIRSWRALKVLAADDVQRVLILAPLCGLGAVVVHTHITFHFYVLSILLIAGLMLAFWFSETQKILQGEALVYKPRSAGADYALRCVLLAPLALGIWQFTVLNGSYLLTQRAQARMAAGDLEGFADDVNRADRLAGGRNERALIMAAAVPLGILETAAPGEAERLALAQQTTGLLERAWDLNPRLAVILYYRARAAVARNEKEEAQALLENALVLDPLHLGARLMLADLYRENGEPDKATGVFADGLRWIKIYRAPLPFLERAAMDALGRGDIDGHLALVKIMKRMRDENRKNKGAVPAPARDFRDFTPN